MIFGALQTPLSSDLALQVRGIIAASVAKDPCESLDDVMRDIQTGEALAWVATEGTTINGVTVTQILEGSKAKQCFIRHCAGEDLRDWVAFIDVIKTYARLNGCASIEYIGRQGFARLLGWPVQAVLCREMLTDAPVLKVREARCGQ